MAINASSKANIDIFFVLNKILVFISKSVEAEYEVSDHVHRTHINLLDRNQLNILF